MTVERFVRSHALAALAGAALVAAASLAAAPDLAAQVHAADSARAQMADMDGNSVGGVLLVETAGQGVILDIRLFGLEPGQYAIHIHETGRCQPPSFESAGGHYNPEDRAHGFHHHDGRHAGDLLNLRVNESGEVSTERHAPLVTLEHGADNTLFDSDGSAIVVHLEPDDYMSQPSGDAGDRLYCGVIER